MGGFLGRQRSPGQLSPLGDGSTTQSPALRDRPCDGVFFRPSHVISRRESARDLTWMATRGTTTRTLPGIGLSRVICSAIVANMKRRCGEHLFMG